ncbi:MAG: glycosyltransferase [Candidatus Binatia bacterium]
MKLLIVTGIFPPDIGGPAYYVPLVAAELSRRGHSVCALTLSDSLAHDDSGYPFQVVRIRRGLFKPFRLLLTAIKVLVLGRKTDTLFVNGLYLESVVANFFLRKPMVQKIVGDWAWERATNKGWSRDAFEEFQRSKHSPRVEVLKALRNFCARRADMVIVPSQFLARWVQSWGVVGGKLRVIYNAVGPLNGKCEVPIRLDTRFKMITAGRLVSCKGMDDLVQILLELDDVGLVVVGDGPEERRLRSLAKQFGVDERVCFTGKLDSRRLRFALSDSDLFVINSNHEGFPHVVLEAMQVGLPVVATNVGGTREVIEDQRNGLLVPPGERAVLEQAIKGILADPDRRREIARIGQETVLNRFSLDRMVVETQTALEEAWSQPRRSWCLVITEVWDELRGKAGAAFTRHVAALTIANTFSTALSFAQGIVVARTLGPQLYGVVALVLSYPSLLFSLLDARSWEASVKFLGEFSVKQENGRAVAFCKLGYGVDLGVALLTFILVATTAWWAEEHIVHVEGIGWLMVFYAAAFLPRSLVGTSYAVLATLDRFPALAWVESLTATVRVALVVGLVLSGWGVAGVILGNSISIAFQGIALGIIAYPAIRQAWGLSWVSGSWHELKGRGREIFSFLFYNDFNALLGLIAKQLDVVILGYFRGPTETGYYRLAKSTGALVGNLVGPLQSVTYPRLTHLCGSQRKDEIRQAIRRYAFWIGAPLGVLLLISLPLLPLLISVMVGEQFRPAAFAAQLLLASSAVWLAFFWIRPLFLAEGHVRVWANISILIVVLLSAGFLLVTPRWGFLGMAWWLLVMQVFGHCVALAWQITVRTARAKYAD